VNIAYYVAAWVSSDIADGSWSRMCGDGVRSETSHTYATQLTLHPSRGTCATLQCSRVYWNGKWQGRSIVAAFESETHHD
jgi:diaminopimelate epimerase